MSGIFLPTRPVLAKPPIGARFNPSCALMHGLQCLYIFNEGGGSAFAEASGQHPAATLTVGSGGGAPWANGIGGTTAQFNSTIGYANAGNICDNLGSFSVSLWFKTSSSPSDACIVGKMGSGGFSTGQGWGVFQAGGEFGIFTQLSGGSTYRQINTTSNYNDFHWHHAVFTVSGYLPASIYIDGVKVATSSSGSGTITTTTNTGSLGFGCDTGSSSDYWNGLLDVTGIWNRVLGADEIERLHIEPFYFMSPGGQTYFSKARIVKKPVVNINVTQGGITSQEKFGAQGAAESLLPLGFSTQETFGASSTIINNARNVFPTGIPTTEAEGAILFSKAIGPDGIVSGEAEGRPAIGLNLLPLGLTSSELLGALKTAIATHNPINIPLRRRSAFSKPPVGAILNRAHPLANGLAAAFIMNEGGGATYELISGAKGSLAGNPSVPAWQSGLFGTGIHFPGGATAGRISIPERPAYTNLGLTGGMSVSFWYNYDAAQLALPVGASIMGKNDGTDGGQGNGLGFTHGWVINSDNWHLVSGDIITSGPQNIKLEFECGVYNKQGGIPAPTSAGVWHHIVMTTVGGASTPTVNDYAIYLDGVLQSNIFFVAGNGDPTVSDSGYLMAIGSHPSGTAPFNGFLDNVLLYNRCLTGTEAQLLYTDPFCFMNKPQRRIRATHSTSNLSITPLGIVSAEHLGAMGIPSAQIISPLGIASLEKFGALQTVIADIQALYPGAIVSLESQGAGTVIIAVPIATPADRTLNPAQQYRIFNLKIEERIL